MRGIARRAGRFRFRFRAITRRRDGAWRFSCEAYEGVSSSAIENSLRN